ncbi:MAG: hypothetical protein JW951_05925 [Lentisphaerae bacterium]|nr:hypothetical protein [Lentisphaerota bacterium]
MSPLWLLLRKDGRALRNLGRTLRRESRFKLGFVALFACGLLAGLFALFLDGFRFLDSIGGSGFMITRRLFALFYLALSVMLALSSIVTAYATMYRSRETGFLLTGPVPTETLVTYKFLESALLSSWAFFFIIAPFASAYAWHESLGVPFALWTLLFSVPFLTLCSGVGVLVSLVLVRWAPRGRVLPLVLALAAGLAVWAAAGGGRAPDPGEAPTFVLSRIVPGLQAASHPLLPSWWAAEGVMACTGGQTGRGLMLWLVLVSNMFMLLLLVQGLGRRLFYAGYQRMAGGGGRRRRRSVLLRRTERMLRGLNGAVRGMVIKDVRTFLRDPMQWSQAAIFFGLLALYFANIRSFYYDRLPDTWRNLVAFLNVFSVAAVQCSLASRFIFPQLSLEGHAFWVLGLSPTPVRRILMTKFALSLAGMLAVSVGLMLISTAMLQVAAPVRAAAVALAVAISCAVCGLSTGLGAVFLDLRTANPMAVVSGFGGTLNLVLSLAFMLAVILPTGLLFHVSALGRIAPDALQRGLAAASVWVAGLTAAAVALPLWLGRRALVQRDY